MEERFCSRVKQMGCTCITISHRPALVAFHDLVLALDGEGGWTIRRGARAQEGRTSFDGEEPSGVAPSLRNRGYYNTNAHRGRSKGCMPHVAEARAMPRQHT